MLKVSQTEFAKELIALLNKCVIENEPGSPDFIVAQYVSGCIDALEHNQARNKAMECAIKEWERLQSIDI